MKIIVFVVKEKYRRTNFNNFINKKRYGKYIVFLINEKNIDFLEIVLSVLSKIKIVTVVYTDREYLKRKKAKRLWWNDINELNDEEIKNKNNIFACESVFLKHKTLKLYPFNIRQIKVKNEPKIIYIGEIDIKIKNETVRLWDAVKDEILNNLCLISTQKFWDREQFINYSSSEKQKIYYSFNNLIRYEGIKFLNENYNNLELIGNDWIDLKLTNLKSNHNKDYRLDKYNSNICPDFGSKSGTNALFHRSIEIIESGGILIQVKRIDSYEVYGKEIYDMIVFNNFEEMKEKITKLTSDKRNIIHINKLLIEKVEDFEKMQISALDSLFM